MSEKNCINLIDEYTQWLREQITVSDVNGLCEITTPFLDRHNDYLQIYLFEKEGKFILSDGGYILSDLRMSGVEFNTSKRSDVLNTILQGFGIHIYDNYELSIEATKKDIAQKKHLLLQAMLAINDLFVMAQPTIVSLFLEDVEAYLNSMKIRFISKISFTGISGYSHYFDFAIPKSSVSPDRYIKAINTPNKNNISSLIFSWNDIKSSRPDESIAIAFLNDQEKNVSDDSIIALENYGIKPISWTKREASVNVLES